MAKKKTPETVSDLVFDDKNFNKGNPFGEGLIEKSFSKFGAGRSILLDKNNRIIAGNKSTQKFAEGGGEKIIVVETDGKTLVAVKRTDIDLDTPQGREMALADNMAASKNITMDAELIEAEVGEAVMVEWGVNLFKGLTDEEMDNFFKTDDNPPKEGMQKIVLEYSDKDFLKVKEAMGKIATTPEKAVWFLLSL